MASITKRPNGRWRARYRDEANREHARHFERKVDAQRWLNEVTAALVTGTYVDPGAGRVTFDKHFEAWAKRQTWAPGTEIQADLVRRSVPFGDVPLGRLRNSHIQQWVKEMNVRGYAANTVHSRVRTVRTALRSAVRDRVIVSDPSVGLSLPRRRPRERAMQVATAQEVGSLLAASDGHMKAFIGLCAFAGLRLGEASGVKVSDVDFLRRRLEVVRQVQKRRGGPEIRPPKYGSERTVYLPDELVTMLSAHVEQHDVSSEGWLFMGGSGQPLPPSTVNSWWQRTVHAAETRPVTIHALRHFYASGLIAAGCDVVTVQGALGHKSPSVTLNTYSHLWPKAEDKTRLAAGALASEAFAAADSLRTEAAK